MLNICFGSNYASATAVNAVSDLRQRKETCAKFLDRVVVAVKKQNFNKSALLCCCCFLLFLSGFFLLHWGFFLPGGQPASGWAPVDKAEREIFCVHMFRRGESRRMQVRGRTGGRMSGRGCGRVICWISGPWRGVNSTLLLLSNLMHIPLWLGQFVVDLSALVMSEKNNVAQGYFIL